MATSKIKGTVRGWLRLPSSARCFRTSYRRLMLQVTPRSRFHPWLRGRISSFKSSASQAKRRTRWWFPGSTSGRRKWKWRSLKVSSLLVSKSTLILIHLKRYNFWTLQSKRLYYWWEKFVKSSCQTSATCRRTRTNRSDWQSYSWQFVKTP